jgi:hypothetical protein
MNKDMQQFSSFYDLLIEHCMMKRPEMETIEDVKQYLTDIDHPEKDNASFCYEFFNFLKEPFCV